MKSNGKAWSFFAVAVVAAVIAGGAFFHILQPKPRSALEKMTSHERLAYFDQREAYDLVGYYCGDAELSSTLEKDLEQALRDKGVGACSSGDLKRTVPSG
ncbi:MAG: hypothetical protein AAGA09_01560 [Pseudomonadota bacterium]